MDPCTIRPITLDDTTAAYLWRVLHANRFLQVPEGWAFLLDQLRRRIAILPYANHVQPCDPKACCPSSSTVSGCQASPADLIPVDDEPAAPIGPPALKLEWVLQGLDKPATEVTAAPPRQPAPMMVLGSIFDVVI